MPEIEIAVNTRPLVEDIDREVDQLQARLNAQEQEQARKWGVPCPCDCGCRVRFRFGKVCALCQINDHWTRITEYLDRVMNKEES